MKNIILGILFIGSLLSMPIVAFMVGANLIGWVFVTFYVIFGIYEIVFKKIFGKTVSQDTWKLTFSKKLALTIAMVAGWTALILHLWKIF